MRGRSSAGIGVQGLIPSTSGAANTIAVQGLNLSSGGNSNGVYGSSATGYGVVGYSTGGSASVSGISTNINIPAFAGGNSVSGGLAASFGGTVFVNGKLVVTDPSYKSGMLKHPDGSHRLVYCVESPESWIEDVGKGTLTSGKAEVRFDPDFAAVVQTGEYHVFLTPYDGVGALRAARRTAMGFAVEEIGGASSGGFTWRVMAKPKTEKKLSRLEKFVPPDVLLPDPARLPKPVDEPMPSRTQDVSPQGAPPVRPSAPTGASPATAPQGGTMSPAASPVQPAPPPRP
jgi:hypothetical protein